MILNQKLTHIAFRCPKCASATKGIAGTFALSKNRMLRMRCSCGRGGEMSAVATNDDKIRITVPCLFCEKNHQFTISKSLFFTKELFVYACPYTSINIAFFGQDEEKLGATAQKCTEELEKLFDELSVRFPTENEDGKDFGDETVTPDVLPDAQIYDIIRFMVKELEADGAIHCPCRSGEYDMEMTERGVRVFCQSCGASHLFETDSVAAAQEFLSCDRLDLQ